MQTARSRLGRKAEIATAAELGKRGYRIVGSNYRCKSGEIDLICRDGDTLVFVEVRCKSTSNYGTPAESITQSKQQKIAATAQHYLIEHGFDDVDCRFDVAEVAPEEGGLAVHVIRDAFSV